MTPMLKQYLAIKKQYHEAILFFRLGDFYEMFFEDAERASQILGITLTSREGGKGNRIPMCGVPYHSAQGYINRLNREGLKVAVCEQVEDPKAGKEIVKRQVIRVVTPGTNIEDELPDSQGENFIAGLYQAKGLTGIAFLNLGTGFFQVAEIENHEDLLGELTRINPRECIVSEKIERNSKLHQFLSGEQNIILNYYEGWVFEPHYAAKLLKNQFNLASLEGLGLEGYSVGVSAAGAIIHYLQDNLHHSLQHVKRPTPYSSSEYMILDRKTQINLEILQPISGERRGLTLFKVLNKTITPLGFRLLRRWIKQPLILPELINSRLEAVEEILGRGAVLSDLRESMKDIRDLERILGHLSCGSGSARDLIALKEALQKIPNLRRTLASFTSPLLMKQRRQLHELDDLVDLINRAIVDAPPLSTKEGGMIRPGYSRELDELHQVAKHGKDWLVKLQQREIERTGIKSLKVRYNKIFGYYIEVTKANLSQVPDYYIRRQTLVNSERFIISELKDYEAKILGAEERAGKIEFEIFEEVRHRVMDYTQEIQEVADAVATFDVLATFAFLAIRYNYIRPIIDNGFEINITDSRHPVVERVLEEGRFVENDAYLNCHDQQLLIITGPNMAGKSTYLRQIALIVLMAQIGSFVPAASARIGVVDKIFTRIGASDNLIRGESTFMVEMIETAHILNSASHRSLVILDEVGRGTSTFDGVSIAWAVCEFLTRPSGPRPKTLFATHYHELTGLERLVQGAKNYNVLVRESEDEVVFMRKISPGGADRSYGIQVGKLAGLPDEVILRAQKILSDLENGSDNNELAITRLKVDGVDKPEQYPVISLSSKPHQKPPQENIRDLPFLNQLKQEHSLIKEIKEIDIQNMTPLEALNCLNQLKEKAKSYRFQTPLISIRQYQEKGW